MNAPDTSTTCFIWIPPFSVMAYAKHSISEEEIQQSLDSTLINWSPQQEQKQSPFCQLPLDIKKLFFNSMDSSTVKRCLLVSKEFLKLALPSYVQLALTEDFKKEESAIDKQPDCQQEVNSESETVAASTNSSKMEAAAIQINKFKNFCLILYNNCEINAAADRQKVKEILSSTMKLQKACLEKQEQPRSEEQQALTTS